MNNKLFILNQLNNYYNSKMKVSIGIKLTLMLSLISMSFSWSVMNFGKYTKDSFSSKDAKISKAYNYLNKQIVESTGFSNVQVYPISIYRQILNGINYKILAAVKDEKNKKVDLVNSTVYIGPFTDSPLDLPNLAFQQNINSDFKGFKGSYAILFHLIERLIKDELAPTNSTLQLIKSLSQCSDVVNDEVFYLVDADVISQGISLKRYFLISHEIQKGLSIVQTFDFPN